MTIRRRFLSHIALATAIYVPGAFLLAPIFGIWRSAAILILASILAMMYVDHRWPLRERSGP